MTVKPKRLSSVIEADQSPSTPVPRSSPFLRGLMKPFKKEGATPVPLDPEVEANLTQISELPKDVGWMLLITGLLSEVAPLIPPFWILGILILWPDLGSPAGRVMHRKCPRLFKGTVDMVNQYAKDLEKRYPRNEDEKA